MADLIFMFICFDMDPIHIIQCSDITNSFASFSRSEYGSLRLRRQPRSSSTFLPYFPRFSPPRWACKSCQGRFRPIGCGLASDCDRIWPLWGLLRPWPSLGKKQVLLLAWSQSHWELTVWRSCWLWKYSWDRQVFLLWKLPSCIPWHYHASIF